MRHILKSKIFLFMMATVLVFVAMLASHKTGWGLGYFGDAANMVFIPIKKVVTYPKDVMDSWWTYIQGVESVKQENADLQLKVADMESQNRELNEYRARVRELEQILSMRESNAEFTFVGGNVVAGDMGNWFNVFVIDVGKNKGIENDSCVITSQGLVGKTFDCTAVSSKVMSILDSDNAVSARITKTRDLVVVKGESSIQKEGLCRVDYIPPDADLEVGDMVETSGLGGIFPKGIIIGKVTLVGEKGDGVSKYANIKPMVNFEKLEEVMVLKK